MAQRNGGGQAFETAESVTGGTQRLTSQDRFAGAASEDPFAEKPELLLGAALLGGLVLAGLVSRIGR